MFRPAPFPPTVPGACCAVCGESTGGQLFCQCEAAEEPEEFYDAVTKANTTCLKKAGGWPALNGDPEWKLEPNLLLGGVWQELPIAVITKVAELEDNGGGFTNAGPVRVTHHV